MTTYGVTDAGFTLKRLADILTDINAQLALIVDETTGETLNLTDENDPLINLRDSVADALSVLWEQAQLCYNQFDPLKATGAGLSGLVLLNNIQRQAGIASTVVLTMTGTAGVSIAAGKQCALYDGSVIFDLPAWTFDSGGSATVTGTCTLDGPYTAAAGEVTKIVTPVFGWSACMNAAPATVGSAPETDIELRARQQASTETTGRSTIEDIYGNLANLDGVTWVRVYQNNTDVTDGRGIPARSIAPVILGGDNNSIAEMLFSQTPAIAGVYGTTMVNVVDIQGIEYGIRFTRPAEVPIYISIALTVVNASTWPTDGEDQIRAAIIEYAASGASGLGISNGFDQSGYAPGQSVYASELYTPINSVPGARITSLLIGETPGPTAQSVSIDWNEIAGFSEENISITKV